MSTMHPDDTFLLPSSKSADVATAPDFEIPRSQIKTPHAGEYAERVSWTYGVKLDAAGNYAGSIYDVRQGYKLTPIRLTLCDPTGLYTPAVPYANAACWIGIFADDLGPAAMSDFAPNTPGGPVIPGMWSYQSDGGPICRQFLGLRVVTGPANLTVTINGIGVLREA